MQSSGHGSVGGILEYVTPAGNFITAHIIGRRYPFEVEKQNTPTDLRTQAIGDHLSSSGLFLTNAKITIRDKKITIRDIYKLGLSHGSKTPNHKIAFFFLES